MVKKKRKGAIVAGNVERLIRFEQHASLLYIIVCHSAGKGSLLNKGACRELSKEDGPAYV